MKTLKIVVLAAVMVVFSVMAVSAADNSRTAVAKDTKTEISARKEKASEEKTLFGPGYAGQKKYQQRKQKFGPGVTKTGEDATAIEVAPWRLWLVLIILAGMVGGMFYVLRKYGKGILPSSDAQIITVKSKVQLDARNSVSVLRVYDEEFVIGAGTNGVSLLAKLLPIEGSESELEVAAEESEAPKTESDFNKQLDKLTADIESEEVK